MKIREYISRFRSNKTLINGTLFSAFSFINRGISFVLLIILARYIMPAEYGQLSLFTTIVQFLAYFIALSCQGYFPISFFQRKGEYFRQDTTSIILILTVCTTVLSVLMLLFQNVLAAFAGIPRLFLWFAIIISFSQVLYYLFTDYLRIQEKVLRYGLFSCGFAVISFALSVYLVVYKEQDWYGRVYAFLICAVVTGLIGIFFLFKKRLLTRSVTWEGTKMILLWGVPLIPHEATTWIKQGCDRFIINSTHTIEDVGLFSFALTLTSIIVMIGSAFNATNSVSVYQILSSDNSSAQKKILLKRQARNIGAIYTVCYILVLLFGTLIVPIALPKYTASIPFFWITSISGFLECLYFLFVNVLFYYHKNHRIMEITFVTAIFHLLLSFILTRFSLYLTAGIYVVSQLVVLLLIIWQSLKVVKERV